MRDSFGLALRSNSEGLNPESPCTLRLHTDWSDISHGLSRYEGKGKSGKWIREKRRREAGRKKRRRKIMEGDCFSTHLTLKSGFLFVSNQKLFQTTFVTHSSFSSWFSLVWLFNELRGFSIHDCLLWTWAENIEKYKTCTKYILKQSSH